MHQPNYLPWIGFFDKLRRCDVFVLLDEVQYPRGGSVANRNRIRTGNGTLMLTVPVSKPPGSQGKVLYREVRFADAAQRVEIAFDQVTRRRTRQPVVMGEAFPP